MLDNGSLTAGESQLTYCDCNNQIQYTLRRLHARLERDLSCAEQVEPIN